MRVRKKNWTVNEFENNELILQNPDSKGRWNDIFKNNNPLRIEIGCGKGNFITESARLNPAVNFVAIEREWSVIVTGARKIRELKEAGENINNILFLATDATNIDNFFAEDEVSLIYLNFSDPWPNRKKWVKRRLTYRSFLSIYDKLLTKDGEIHFKTDNTQLFEFSLNEFSGQGWGLKNISLDLHSSNFEGNIMTEYEMKFSAKGMSIYRLEAYKR